MMHRHGVILMLWVRHQENQNRSRSHGWVFLWAGYVGGGPMIMWCNKRSDWRGKCDDALGG